MVDLCKEAAVSHHTSGQNSLMYRLGEGLVYSKVKSALGLDRARYFFCAAAPLSEEVSRFFMGLDICLLDAFGMSECTGEWDSTMLNITTGFQDDIRFSKRRKIVKSTAG